MKIGSIDMHCPRCNARVGSPCGFNRKGEPTYHRERHIEAVFAYYKSLKKEPAEAQ